MHPRPQPPVPVPLLFAAALVLLAGCTTTKYVLQVDAISQPETAVAPAREPQSYKIRSHNPGVNEDSLRYNEVSAYIKTALSGKGLYEAPTAESADLIIELDFGMETPRMKYETVMRPIVIAQTNVSMRDAMMTTSGSARPRSSVGSPSQSMLTPKIIGWKEETEPVVVYEKYLKVSARENREAVEGQPAPEIWSVNVSAVDPSDEVRKYMPILASATADFIGTNTRQEKEVAIHEQDETVKFIKKGM